MDDSISIPSLQHQAIQTALDSKWSEALNINEKIIKIDPQNVDALNRLARAYFELGKINLAIKHYSLALKYDSYNPIALKNLKMLKTFKKDGKKSIYHNGQINNQPIRISPSLFLQEPGKCKAVNLLKVAEPQKLSRVYSGMLVDMVVKNRKVAVIDKNGGYLGVLPDDLTHQLLRLMKGGNKYEVLIKSVKVNGLAVLIREIFRSKRFRNQPSFLEGHSPYQTAEIITNMDSEESEENVEAEEEEQ